MEAIQAVRSIISSLYPCPIMQLSQPMLPSVCAALQERLSSTRVTNEAGEQYNIVLQYGNIVFTVTTSSMGGRLPFDPGRIDLPSIPTWVAFYHACLGFPVKDSWLEAIATATHVLDSSTQMLAGIALTLMKPFSDILLKLGKMSAHPNHLSLLLRPGHHLPRFCHRMMTRRKFLSRSTLSANCIRMTPGCSLFKRARAINVLWLLTTLRGT